MGKRFFNLKAIALWTTVLLIVLSWDGFQGARGLPLPKNELPFAEAVLDTDRLYSARVCFDPSGRFMAIGGLQHLREGEGKEAKELWRGAVLIYDLANRALVQELVTGERQPYALWWHPNEPVIAVAGFRFTQLVWVIDDTTGRDDTKEGSALMFIHWPSKRQLFPEIKATDIGGLGFDFRGNCFAARIKPAHAAPNQYRIIDWQSGKVSSFVGCGSVYQWLKKGLFSLFKQPPFFVWIENTVVDPKLKYIVETFSFELASDSLDSRSEWPCCQAFNLEDGSLLLARCSRKYTHLKPVLGADGCYLALGLSRYQNGEAGNSQAFRHLTEIYDLRKVVSRPIAIGDEDEPQHCIKYPNRLPVAFSPNNCLLLVLEGSADYKHRSWSVLDWHNRTVVFYRNSTGDDCICEIVVSESWQYVAEIRRGRGRGKNCRVTVWQMPEDVRRAATVPHE